MRFPDADLAGQSLLERFYPVGSVFVSTTATDPALLLGFGVWEAFGAGRVLVGLDAGDPDFDTLLETGGAKTVTLTAAQSGLPQHTHAQNPHTHGVTDPGHTHVQGVNSATTGGLSGYTPDTTTNTRVNSGYSTSSATTGVTVNNATAVNSDAGPTGAAQAHTNLMPYIVVRVWRRTG